MRSYSELGTVGGEFTPNKSHPYFNVITDTPFIEKTFTGDYPGDWDPFYEEMYA